MLSITLHLKWGGGLTEYFWPLYEFNYALYEGWDNDQSTLSMYFEVQVQWDSM